MKLPKSNCLPTLVLGLGSGANFVWIMVKEQFVSGPSKMDRLTGTCFIQRQSFTSSRPKFFQYYLDELKVEYIHPIYNFLLLGRHC